MEKIIDYLNVKFSDYTIEFNHIERKYSKQYGWEYHVYFKKNGVMHKDVLTQFQYTTL